MPFNPSALQSAAADGPDFDEPPEPDVYEATLTKAEPFVSKAGDDILRVGWKVLTGRLRDHRWSMISTLEEDAPGLPVTASLMRAILGRDPSDSLSDLVSVRAVEQALQPMIGKAYEVEVKRNGQYVNTYVKRALAAVQTDLPTGGYGSPQSSSAIFQGDAPEPRYPEKTGESDAGDAGPGEFEHKEYIPKGSIDPETGEPIPF